MSSTINRLQIGRNDDGTGTYGTLVDTGYIGLAIYDQIDAMFATSVAFGGVVSATYNVNSLQSNTFANIAAGVSTASQIVVFDHGTPTVGAILRYNASTFTATGIHVAQGAELVGSGTGGIAIASTDPNGVNRFFSGGTTERARQDAAGHWQFRNQCKLGWHDTPGSTTTNYITGDDAANTITINANTGGVFVTGAGLLLGAPTGGNKGVGTANFAADIYKNNTAYTNPAFVFEQHYTGRVVRFADRRTAAGMDWYDGLKPLSEVEAFVRACHDLPLMARNYDAGLFGRGDQLLATVEEAYLYLFDLHRRLSAIEEKAA